MKQPILFVFAALLALVGLIWIFQGVGVIKGSFMTGQLLWTFIGIAVLIVAGGLFWLGSRPSRSK
jgi:hypothetical protein